MTKPITRSTHAERAEGGFVVLSTDTPCPQDGLILAPGGWDLSRTERVPLKMFYNHATSWGDEFPIGRWEDVQVKEGKLVGRPVFAAEEHPERAGVVAKLWEGGFLDDVSVSFRVNGKALTGPVQVDGRDYMVSTSHELIECSIVGIGADQNAGKGRLEEAVTRGVLTRAEANIFSPAPDPPGREPHGNTDPHAEGDISALRAELLALKEEVARLRSELGQAAPPATPAAEPPAQPAEPEPESAMSADDVRKTVRAALTTHTESTVERMVRRLTGRLPD